MREFNDYPLETEGIWNIYGEDPNCDMTGHHHEPFLDRVEGRYVDAIVYSKNLPGFIQWGRGGKITKHSPTKIKNIYGHASTVLSEYYANLESERDRLKLELQEVERNLKPQEKGRYYD